MCQGQGEDSMDGRQEGHPMLPGNPAPTVVAIDDDPNILLLISRTLTAEGMVCHTAATGSEGLRLIRAHRPDLVLLDIVLVGEDGFTVCREIRRTWPLEDLPVVMVTGLEDLASIQAAYQAGANDYLTKPLHWKHLPYRIRHVLQANQALKALQDRTKTLRSLFSVHPDLILTLDAKGLLNVVHSGIPGDDGQLFPPAGLLDDVLPRDLAELMHRYCREALADPAEVFSLEFTHPLGNSPRFWEARFVACADDRALVMLRDITERRRAEQALQESEERYQRITEAITDYIYTVRLAPGTGSGTTHGPGCQAVTGYQAEEFARDPFLWIRMVADEDRPLVQEQARLILAGEDPPPVEHRIVHKNGTVRWVRNTFVPHFDEHGALETYDGLVQDITERKRAEEALRESAQRLELAVQSGSLGIWDHNLQDGTVIWNDRMYELFGVDRETFQPNDQSWVERLVHPDDRLELQEKITAAIKNGLPYGAAFRAALPGGGIRYIAANGTVIRDSEGRPVRAIGVNRDRTEQVQAESERRRLQEERQHSEKLESLGSLAGGVAHDMNNVLAAIMGLTSALRSTCPDEDPRAKSLESILHASNRGRELVKALTDFARKGLEEPRQLDLNKTLRKEVELLLHAKSPEVQVVLDLDPCLPTILGDAPALGSAIINLGINALDAMPGGGTLSFRSRSLGAGRVELVVADTGHGMTPEVLARAMEPFFTTKPVGKGTGLGLARVYGTVKAHGGSVEIRSLPGQGTSVRMVFPATGIPAQSLEPWAETPPARLRRPLDVLLVDDDDLIRSSTQALLEALGHQSNTASSGEEGLAKLEAGYLPDVVILDMNMPGLGGAETLLRLRVLRPALPVLLATGLADQVVLDLIKVFPKVTLLAKPFTLRELQKHLEIAGVGWSGNL